MIDSRAIFGGSSASNSATKSLYNACSSAGYTGILNISYAGSPFKTAASGVLTANTLVDLINETGSAGFISQLAISTVDATSRTLRTVITVDGTAIYDVTSAALTNANSGAVLAGQTSSGFSFSLPYIAYTTSIRVQYASNNNETGKFTTCLARTQVT